MENQETEIQKDTPVVESEAPAPAEENITVEPIISEDAAGNKFRYFKIKNGPHAEVVFTLVEIGFVDTKSLPGAPEDTPEGDQTATGKVLFENTAGFTTTELLTDSTFGQVARDVFNAVVKEHQDFAAAQEKALQEAAEQPEETAE